MSDKELLLTILDELREFKKNYLLLSSLVPNELSLSEVAKIVGKSPNTLRKYLIANFEPNKDFNKKIGKIYVKQDAIFRIKDHYAK